MEEETIRQAINNLTCIAEENRRTLRGHNGNPGLVAMMTLVQRDMSQLRADLTTELVHLQELLKIKEAATDEKTVQWPKLFKNWLVPVIVAISSSVATGFIMAAIFKGG